jgi:hypothetical protein
MTTRERNLDFGLIGPQWWGTMTWTLPVAQGGRSSSPALPKGVILARQCL